MKYCIDIDDQLNDKDITNLKKDLDYKVRSFTERKLTEYKYTLPEWFERKKKDEPPILTIKEIKEILDMGLNFNIVWGYDDCSGLGMRFEVIDPKSGIDIDEISYYPGWGGGKITEDEILAPFKKFKCDRIQITEV